MKKIILGMTMAITMSANAGWFTSEPDGAFGVEFGSKTTEVPTYGKIPTFSSYSIKTTAKSGLVYKISAYGSIKSACYSDDWHNLRYSLKDKYGESISTDKFNYYTKIVGDVRIHASCGSYSIDIGYKNREYKDLDKKERASNVNINLI